MTNEHLRPISSTRLREVYNFTGEEDYANRVTQERFEEIIGDEATTVHQIQRDFNNYGEFLFVSISRPVGEQRACVTFFGLGHHEHRERWYTDTWFWYQAHPFEPTLSQTIPKDEAKKLVDERREAIARYVTHEPPSPRARLYSILADITDDDGALAELEDLGELADWLAGDWE
jgi:hypothetical protein